MRELRLSPDDMTLGWSHLSFKDHGVEQFAFVGRLTFDDSADDRDTARPPLRPRRRDQAVQLDRDPTRPFLVDEAFRARSIFNPSPPNMGELRGFSSDGTEVFGIN